MEWEAKLIEFMQRGRNGFTDWLFFIITQLGDELFVIAVAAFLYWCINKRYAFKFLNVYFLSVACIEIIKAAVKRPRPFQKYETRIGSVISDTSGYSFPSGHTHSAADISAQAYLVLRKTKHKKTALFTGIIFTFTIAVTRLFLGQHYLTDVLTGAALGVLLAVAFSSLYNFLGNKEEWLFVVVVPVCIVLVIVFSSLGVGGNAFAVLGAYPAFTLGYFMEKRFVKYEVKSGALWKQALKLLIGLGITMAIKETFKLFLPESVPALYDFLRYFLVAGFAALGAPAFFKALKL